MTGKSENVADKIFKLFRWLIKDYEKRVANANGFMWIRHDDSEEIVCMAEDMEKLKFGVDQISHKMKEIEKERRLQNKNNKI